MRLFIIAKDDVEKPKKSALLVGPQEDDDSVRREFYKCKGESLHAGDWPVIELYGPGGFIERSVARNTQPRQTQNETRKEHRK